MDAAGIAEFWSGLPKEINEQSIVLITATSSPTPGSPFSGYAITAIPSETPPKTSGIVIPQIPEFLEKSYFLSRLPPHLCLPPEDIHIVVSTKSGAEQAVNVFDDVLKPVFNTIGLDGTSYQVLRTESGDTIRDFAGGRLRHRADEGVAQTVVLLSGDGAVVDIVNGLMNVSYTRSRYVTAIHPMVELHYL
jgi:hypothetical protein